VPPARQLGAEGYEREGMSRVSERGEEEPPPRSFAQTSSASSRTMRMRSSCSKAIGVIMSVPTPASR